MNSLALAGLALLVSTSLGCAGAAVSTSPTPVSTTEGAPRTEAAAPTSATSTERPRRAPTTTEVEMMLRVLAMRPERNATFVVVDSAGSEIAAALVEAGHTVIPYDCNSPIDGKAPPSPCSARDLRWISASIPEGAYLVLPSAFDWRYIPRGIFPRAQMIGLWVADALSVEDATARRPLGDGRELRAYSPRPNLDPTEAARAGVTLDGTRIHRTATDPVAEEDRIVPSRQKHTRLADAMRVVAGAPGEGLERARLGAPLDSPSRAATARVSAAEVERALTAAGPSFDAASAAFADADLPRAIHHVEAARAILAEALGPFAARARLVRELDAIVYYIREPIDDPHEATCLLRARSRLSSLEREPWVAPPTALLKLVRRLDQHFAARFAAQARASTSTDARNEWAALADAMTLPDLYHSVIQPSEQARRERAAVMSALGERL